MTECELQTDFEASDFKMHFKNCRFMTNCSLFITVLNKYFIAEHSFQISVGYIDKNVLQENVEEKKSFEIYFLCTHIFVYYAWCKTM